MPMKVKPMPTLSEYGWVLVRVDADERLQDGSTDLIGQRDYSDLHETQVELALQQRVYRDDQRLHHVVEEVRETDDAQNVEARLRRVVGRVRGATGCRNARRIGGETLLHKPVPY